MDDEDARSDKGPSAPGSYVDLLWGMDEKVLIQTHILHRDGGDRAAASAVIQAKAMLASHRAAHWTMWLAITTFALAVATFLLVLATVFGWGSADS